LFYDRVSASAIPTQTDNKADKKEEKTFAQPTASAAATVNNPNKVNNPYKGATKVRAAVPPRIFASIFQNNLTNLRDQIVFDKNYFNFLINLARDFKAETVSPSSEAELSSVRNGGNGVLQTEEDRSASFPALMGRPRPMFTDLESVDLNVSGLYLSDCLLILYYS
jgi:hypothetical protein